MKKQDVKFGQKIEVKSGFYAGEKVIVLKPNISRDHFECLIIVDKKFPVQIFVMAQELGIEQ